MDNETKLTPGCRVTVQGVAAIYRGPNPKIPGDYWIEFYDGGGWWSYSPSDVEPVEEVSHEDR